MNVDKFADDTASESSSVSSYEDLYTEIFYGDNQHRNRNEDDTESSFFDDMCDGTFTDDYSEAASTDVEYESLSSHEASALFPDPDRSSLTRNISLLSVGNTQNTVYPMPSAMFDDDNVFRVETTPVKSNVSSVPSRKDSKKEKKLSRSDSGGRRSFPLKKRASGTGHQTPSPEGSVVNSKAPTKKRISKSKTLPIKYNSSHNPQIEDDDCSDNFGKHRRHSDKLRTRSNSVTPSRQQNNEETPTLTRKRKDDSDDVLPSLKDTNSLKERNSGYFLPSLKNTNEHDVVPNLKNRNSGSFLPDLKDTNTDCIFPNLKDTPRRQSKRSSMITERATNELAFDLGYDTNSSTRRRFSNAKKMPNKHVSCRDLRIGDDGLGDNTRKQHKRDRLGIRSDHIPRPRSSDNMAPELKDTNSDCILPNLKDTPSVRLRAKKSSLSKEQADTELANNPEGGPKSKRASVLLNTRRSSRRNLMQNDKQLSRRSLVRNKSSDRLNRSLHVGLRSSATTEDRSRRHVDESSIVSYDTGRKSLLMMLDEEKPRRIRSGSLASVRREDAKGRRSIVTKSLLDPVRD